LALAHNGLYIAKAFVHGSDLIAMTLKQSAVRRPRDVQGFERIMKETDIAGDPPTSR